MWRWSSCPMRRVRSSSNVIDLQPGELHVGLAVEVVFRGHWRT